jgi:hypothetical protein
MRGWTYQKADLRFSGSLRRALMLGLAAMIIQTWGWAAPTAVPDGEVPSFYVRAVTGPLAGKSVCYVCRNGDRPVVIVMLRDLSPEATSLLKELDQAVNRNRASGLRCFAVLFSDKPQRDSARLQTLAFDEKIELPLTIAGEAAMQGSTLAFPPEATLAVITYQDRRIIERFSFSPGGCDAKARQSVLVASERMLRPDRPE